MTIVVYTFAAIGAWFVASVAALFGFVTIRDWRQRVAAKKFPGFTPAQAEALRRLDAELKR